MYAYERFQQIWHGSKVNADATVAVQPLIISFSVDTTSIFDPPKQDEENWQHSFQLWEHLHQNMSKIGAVRGEEYKAVIWERAYVQASVRHFDY